MIEEDTSDAEKMVAALKLAFDNERQRDEGIIELEVRMRALELRLARMEQHVSQLATRP